ncbi:hypothetical protein AMELA_G00129400 [Ameiurus melas]|uniref:Major facilitator superfamily (MFS) profile domain-containing protein n=1 Tax=Ameiurus melas TaxID=219545 RepID=A0A7J6AP16_AMEME|nr:hypothetical protein AMELA_G00129400 [Ameiurus melas]
MSIFFVEFQTQFSTDYSTTSWINSLLDFTTMLCAPLGSYVGNRQSTRVAVITGGLLSSAGLVLSSFAPSLQFLYVSLGILTGLGFALSYTPAVAMVGTYFNERKALAYGIAMSGRGIGIFILPPLLQHLIDLYSWRGALLTLGGLVSNLCVCGSLMRPLVGQSIGEKENVKQILDQPDVQEDLKTVQLAGIGQNEDKCDKEQEEEKSLLRSQGRQASREGVGVKMKDSNQEEVKDKENEHEDHSEDFMLTDTEVMIKDSKQDTNSEPTNLKDSSVESTVKDSNRVTRLTKSNLSKSMIAELQIADLKLKDSKLINLMLADTKQTDSKLVCSALGNSKLADLDAHADSNLSKSKLCVLGLPDSKLLEFMQADSKLAESEVTDSNLSDSMLHDLHLVQLMLADPKLATPKLPDSQLLCEIASSEGPGFPITQSRKRREQECCLVPPSSDKYSFLLKPDFLLLSVSFLFLAFGCSVPFVYLVPYSLSVDISHHQAVLLVSILGIMGIVGNITFGWISDRKCLRTFRVVTFLIAVGFEGLSCLFVPLLRTFFALVSFSIFYGFFDGAYMALIPVVTCDLVGSAHLSTALGVVGFLHAIPYLISPPVAGWLLDWSGSYTSLFLLSGLSLLCSTFILAALALLRHCSRGRFVSLQNQQQA